MRSFVDLLATYLVWHVTLLPNQILLFCFFRVLVLLFIQMQLNKLIRQYIPCYFMYLCQCLLMVIEEERSMFWEVIGSDIVREKVHMYVCLILNFYRKRAVWVSRPNSARFCLWGWMKSEVYKRKVDSWDEFLARIFDAAARIQRRKDQLRRTTRDLRTRVAKCIAVFGVFFMLWIFNLNIKLKLK
jgi:hypothetical protein